MNNFENVENIKKKFNWGAFLLTWFWGIGNKTYISLITIPIALIPKVGLIINIFIAIWLGFNGNKLALKNKEFESLENFIKYQKKWSIAGIILYSIAPIILITNCCKNHYKVHNYQKKIEKINSTRDIKESTKNSTLIIE